MNIHVKKQMWHLLSESDFGVIKEQAVKMNGKLNENASSLKV